ncbi:hypothetical protein [Chryseobacterium caseinilyticum]|uniref:Molybdenum ABC transporter permease n=1 Tax=Chryseobacterium caseinilyticum TaxID=2771428 RepID=A0ABR8ZCR2_9FLAO|nr:hypothetical protein [Chryseobacterium caseinilyticum]MBD8083094.1 hypothetical protein [Chryseobacterium caseinilyticum]
MEIIFGILMLLLMGGAIVFFISFVIAKITEGIFHWRKQEFSSKQFWQTIAIAALLILIISGMVCGGLL